MQFQNCSRPYWAYSLTSWDVFGHHIFRKSCPKICIQHAIISLQQRTKISHKGLETTETSIPSFLLFSFLYLEARSLAVRNSWNEHIVGTMVYTYLHKNLLLWPDRISPQLDLQRNIVYAHNADGWTGYLAFKEIMQRLTLTFRDWLYTDGHTTAQIFEKHVYTHYLYNADTHTHTKSTMSYATNTFNEVNKERICSLWLIQKIEQGALIYSHLLMVFIMKVVMCLSVYNIGWMIYYCCSSNCNS